MWNVTITLKITWQFGTFRQIKVNIIPRQNINRRLWNNQSLHGNLGTYGDTFKQKAMFKVETALVQLGPGSDLRHWPHTRQLWVSSLAQCFVSPPWVGNKESWVCMYIRFPRQIVYLLGIYLVPLSISFLWSYSDREHIMTQWPTLCIGIGKNLLCHQPNSFIPKGRKTSIWVHYIFLVLRLTVGPVQDLKNC